MAAAVLGLAAAVVVIPAFALSEHAGSKVTTLRFVQIQTSEHFTGKVPGPGVMDIITTNLLTGSKVVGHAYIVGIVTALPNVEIIRTDTLPSGHISSIDTFNSATTTTEQLAIVGGTGAYSNARGYITLTHPAASKVGIVFTITTS